VAIRGEVALAARRMRPFPDGGKAVSTLRSAGFGVGVLTNSSTESAESLVIGRDWSPARGHGRGWVSQKERVPPRIDPAPDIEVETLAEAAEKLVQSG